jgi:hypothetical protein
MACLITIDQAELEANGYVRIVSQEDETVRVETEEGRIETFTIRESYAGWNLRCEDGRVLEFCSSEE